MKTINETGAGPVVLADDAATSDRAPWWIIVPALVLALAVGVLYVRQRFLLIPVPTRPLTGDVVDTRRMVGFTWNKMSDAPTVYRLQVADSRTFKRIVFETRIRDKNEIKQRDIVEPRRRYYWRMCAIRDGKASPWTRTIRFSSE